MKLKTTLASLVTAATLLLPTAASPAKPTRTFLPNPDQIVYDVVEDRVIFNPFTGIEEEFAQGLIDTIIEHGCEGGYGPQIRGTRKNHDYSPDPQVIDIDIFRTGQGKKQKTKRITVTAVDVDTLVAAGQLYSGFSGNNFDNMNCQRMGELFEIAEDTPVVTTFGEEVEIILSEHGNVEGIRYQPIENDQEGETSFSISIDPLQFRYIIDPEILENHRSSQNGSIIGLPISAWRIADAREQIEIYRNFLVEFHTTEAPIIFPGLYNLTEEDIQSVRVNPTTTVYVINVPLEKRVEEVEVEDQTPSMGLAQVEPEIEPHREGELDNGVEDFYAIEGPVEDSTPGEDYFRLDEEDTFEFEEQLPAEVQRDQGVPDYVEPKKERESPTISEERPEQPETTSVSSIKPVYSTPKPENTTLTPAEQGFTVEYIPETEQLEEPIASAYTNPRGLRIPAITDRNSSGLVNICKEAKGFDTQLLREHFLGVDGLMSSAYPLTKDEQETVHVVSIGVQESNFGEQTLDVLACDPTTYRPLGRGKLTPTLPPGQR